MNNHGGKRKGAGRKPSLVPKKKVTIELEQSLIERLDAAAKREGSKPKAISKMLDIYESTNLSK